MSDEILKMSEKLYCLIHGSEFKSMWLPLFLPPLVQYPSSPATLSNSSRHLQKGKIISHINDVGGEDNGQKGEGKRGRETAYWDYELFKPGDWGIKCVE